LKISLIEQKHHPIRGYSPAKWSVRAIAPHWSYINEDGVPNVKSVMAMQDYQQHVRV